MTDIVTALALSVQNPVLSAVGHLLGNEFFYIAIVIGLVVAFERKNDKRLKILLLISISFLLGWIVKYLVAEPRPCLGAIWCPLDYAFPSTHALVAFAIMFGFMKKKSFPFFIAFAVFISFTRMNIGVHSFGDILGAIPIAIFGYYITEIAWARFERKGWLKRLDAKLMKKKIV
jgi:membrane-associated phospholipid phosphatase